MLLSLVHSRLDAHLAGLPPHAIVRRTLLLTLACYATLRLLRSIRQRGVRKALLGIAFSLLKQLPVAQRRVAQEQQQTLTKLESMVISKEASADPLKCFTLPDKGMSRTELMTTLQRWSEHETKLWSNGQVSGGIYHGDKQLLDFACQAYSLFALSNPLHPDVFPYVRKMESEVISMTAALFNGSEHADTLGQAVGCMTSGGTESILMACKTYRDRAVAEYGMHPSDCEIVCCTTVHAAFNKAAQYLGMRLVQVPCDPLTFRIDVAKAKAALSRNTVVLVGSAPTFPNGILDPIEDLAALVRAPKWRGRIGLHVDACLGGFLMPFAERCGRRPYQAFDFRVPGVTSISADQHKFAACVKGVSTVLYRNAALRRYQYSVVSDWTGGIYATPTMAGSRPGGLIAATFATMLAMGTDGYLACNREILHASQEVDRAIRAIDGLRVLGTPDLSVISFAIDPASSRADKLNIYKVSECMSTRFHWNLNTLQSPASIHLCCTYMHRQAYKRFIKDLKESVEIVASSPDLFKSGSAAIYGMASGLPDSTLVDDLAKGFIDCLFKAK